MSNRIDRQIFWLLLGAGTGLRGLYLLGPGLDSDMAVMGLMAMHILRGEYPIFYWGEPYCGPIESYLAAVLMFFLGPSRAVLNLSPLLFSAAFNAVLYLLAKRLFGVWAGRAALALVALSPAYLSWTSVLARGNYVENLFLGTSLLLMVVRQLESGGRGLSRAVSIGFVAGFAWYVSMQSIHYLLAAGGALLLGAPRFVWSGAGRLAAGFAAGALPFLAFNVANPFASFAAAQGFSRRTRLGASLYAFFFEKVPALLGTSPGPFGVGVRWLGLLSAVVVGACILLGMARIGRVVLGRDAPRPLRARMLLIPLFIAVLGAIVIMRYNQGTHARYLVPLYTGLPVLLAAGLDAIRPRVRYLAAGLLSLVIGVQLAGNASSIGLSEGKWIRDYASYRREVDGLVSWLEGRGHSAVYMPGYWDAFRLTFDAAERVVFAMPDRPAGINKFPAYTDSADRQEKSAWVWRGMGELFEEALAGLGVSYEKVGLGPYEVYHRFRENPSFDAPIPSRGWTARASGRPDDSALAFDRDLGTAWRTGEAQRPGQWFELDLGRPIEVSRIEFLPGFSSQDYPRGLRIETSIDGKTWRVVGLARRVFGSFVAQGEALRLEGSGRMVWRFSPAEARWIRIAQTGHEQVYNWSIAELFVYAPSTAPERSFVPKGPPGGWFAEWDRDLDRGGIAYEIQKHYAAKGADSSESFYRAAAAELEEAGDRERAKVFLLRKEGTASAGTR
ncbi:MAG: discoidin domain-containing protein [Nitrospirota bacterium]